MNTMKYNITRHDQNTISQDKDAIFILCVMRNELARLPYWFEYYRDQGVSQFMVIDNGSTDGTFEYLLAQQDCIVFQTTESYGASKFGVDWANYIGHLYCQDHWTLVVDADELFVFSKKYGDKLKDFVNKVDQTGANSVFCIMVDMYSQDTMANIKYTSGTSFLNTCPMFDTKPYTTLPVKEFPYVNVLGGVRQRMFFPSFGRKNFWDRLGWKLSKELMKFGAFKNSNFLKSISYHRPPTVSKVPLIKWHSGFELISSAHTTTPMKLFEARCALLHFKFFDDFYQRALSESKRKEHFGGGIEYAAYAKKFSKDPCLSMGGPYSQFYDGPETLENAGIITSPDTNMPAPTSIDIKLGEIKKEGHMS